MPAISTRIRASDPNVPAQSGAVAGPSVTVPSPPLGQTLNGTPPVSTNPYLRCPLPNIYVSSPDNLRQFYAGGMIPQYRFPPIPSILGK